SDKGDVHSIDPVDPINVDLWKNELFRDSQVVIAASVKTGGLYPLEIAHPWKGGGDQTVQKLVHALSPEGDLGPNGHSFPQFKGSYVLFGNGGNRFLSSNAGQFIDRMVDEFLVGHRGTYATAHYNLFQPWDLHYIFVIKLLGQRLDHALSVFLF